MEAEEGPTLDSAELLKREVWAQEREHPDEAHDLAEPALKTEVRIYQKMPKIKKHLSPEEVLNWWKVNQERLPLLAALARAHIAVPVSSAPSERLFSTAVNNMTFSR